MDNEQRESKKLPGFIWTGTHWEILNEGVAGGVSTVQVPSFSGVPSRVSPQYVRQDNLKWFTRVLLESGYRPYLFRNADGVRRVVWATHKSRVVEWVKKERAWGLREDVPIIERDQPDVSRLGRGAVEGDVWMNGGEVAESDTILLDPADGGELRILGH